MSDAPFHAPECFDLPRGEGQPSLRISLSRPPKLDAAAADAPVLFVIDADIAFDTAVAIARLRAVGGAAPDAIVVGIGYGADFLDMAKLRTADLTPPLSEEGRKALGNMSSLIGAASGGAHAFLTFILDTLSPEIERRVPQASKTRRLLFGHSLGGLFVAYALLTRPDAFPVYVATSPSLWWDGFAVLSHLPAFAERLKDLSTQPRVLVAVGAKEQDLPTEVPATVQMDLAELQGLVAHARMVDAAAEFADELRRLGLADLEHVSFSDEDHGSVVPAAMSRAITFGLTPWK